MWRARSLIAGLTGAFIATLAFAGDIPPPVKKPRDKTGAVMTQPAVTEPENPSPAITTSHALPQIKKLEDSKTPAPQPLAKHNAEALAEKKAKKDGQPKTGSKLDSEAPAAAKASTASAPPPVPKEWSAQEIDAAKAHCTAVLKDIDAVSVPEPSFRDGECGAPAAVRLISIGKSPQVSLDPPAVLTCDMVVGLHTWMKQDVQPLAKKSLGTEIIKIETMSGYSCRNAYGRKGGKLSEHAHANALDIRGFVTAQAKTAYVLEHWGPIQREIIAAKAAAEKAAAALAVATAEKAKAEVAGKTGVASSGTATALVPTASLTKGTLIDGLPKIGGTKDIPGGSTLGFEPAHLGGPKNKDKLATGKLVTRIAASTESPPFSSRVSGFLHEAHTSACRIFGTTLGPEANNDHRNHFHIDMAPRKTKKICD